MRGKAIIYICVILALALAGCRSSRVVTSGPGADGWHNVVIPMKVVSSGAASLSASGRATMVRGESVYLSVRMIGMEVFSLYASGDSVWIYDRMSGTLAGERLGAVPRSRRRLDVTRLQDILLGASGVPGEFNLDVAAISMHFNVADTVTTPYGMMHSGWNLSVPAAGIEGSLRWNMDQAQWNRPQVSQWKRPASPKRRVEGVNDLLKMLGIRNEE